MGRGARNDLTEILEQAQTLIENLDVQLANRYGLPLFTTDAGASSNAAQRWPEDPERMAPEEMALLVQTRGKDAVDQWLAEHYLARAEREAFGLAEE